ncbi:hypothetical protein L1887_11067 [Cichorium endivia]|nr:hypothetical protein L1887_11067 [Cichorium endivia]
MLDQSRNISLKPRIHSLILFKNPKVGSTPTISHRCRHQHLQPPLLSSPPSSVCLVYLVLDFSMFSSSLLSNDIIPSLISSSPLSNKDILTTAPLIFRPVSQMIEVSPYSQVQVQRLKSTLVRLKLFAKASAYNTNSVFFPAT